MDKPSAYKELKDRVLGETSDPEKEMVNKYRLVFGSPVGRKVLANMLTELHFFDGILDTPEEIALRNYAVVLLNRVGVWNADHVEEITNGIMNIPVEKLEGE